MSQSSSGDSPGKKSLLKRLIAFFSPDYVFPQPKGRRIQGGPAQAAAFWAELEKKRQAEKAGGNKEP